ncbi:DUF538 domain-containing protein [Cephalotus follicularis]|uniref:DUF538 domain-containing protein n=1 Tax=Cephalotus follicularis TaxID=3775 RepID=A0A1Q3BUM1_CEPFO|nr:DUF538 domain-containing protein [Cephalotus follicularis]
MNHPTILTPHITAKVHGQGEMSMVTEDLKAKAEVCYGDETCREKFMLLLTEIGLPIGLLRVQDIEECGYVRDIGFVWLKHKEKRQCYRFDKLVICYDTMVTAYVEHNKIKNLTGVKAKEFLIWINLTEIYVDNTPAAGSITFKTPVGLSKSFPLSLFTSIMNKEQVKEVEIMQRR